MTAATTPAERAELGYRPALDGLRGVAVLLVVLWHVGILARGAGHAGVTLFFVLSGYLITRLLDEELNAHGSVSFRSFYRRRLLRLFPALICLGVAVAAYYLATGRGTLVAGDVGGAWLYVTNWLIIFGNDQGLLDHTWTLAIEEHFYLLWPAFLVFVWSPRRRVVSRVLVAYVVMVVVARAILWSPDLHSLLHKGTVFRFDGILLGCLLALYPRRFGRFSFALAACLLALVALGSDVELMIRYSITAAAVASVILVGHAVHAPPSMLAWKPLVFIGRISYGIYLWHQPIFVVVAPVLITAGWPAWARAILLIPAVLLVATVSYRYIELPFLRLKRPSSRRTVACGPVAAQSPS